MRYYVTACAQPTTVHCVLQLLVRSPGECTEHMGRSNVSYATVQGRVCTLCYVCKSWPRVTNNEPILQM